jgi:glucose/arabinose dehydrogenase
MTPYRPVLTCLPVRRTQTGLPAILSILAAVACSPAAEPDRTVPNGIRVRDGYRLTVAEATLRLPRFMKFGADGTLYVSVPTDSTIYACRDRDGDGYFETVVPFLKSGGSVHGLFWHDGWLWWTESGTISRSRDITGDGQADETVKVLDRDTLPSGGGHWWRSILIHDDRIYTSIGDSGNITDETDTKRQKIWSYALDGSDEKLFASGLRNTEKLLVRPGTDEIWGMDHGSDWFGRELEQREQQGQPITDLNPPDEMNLYREGGFYGHPFIVGKRHPRYEYMDREDITALAARSIPPEWLTGAHWAPNAMEFYTGDQFPDAQGDAFVAYHGSWNRAQPAGYCVTRVLFDDARIDTAPYPVAGIGRRRSARPYGELVYVNFLTDDRKVLGRPVDCAVAPDGSLLISDDGGHRIYRLQYVGQDAP